MALEYRFAALEVRAADGGLIEGVAMPYGREADIAGVFRESVDAGAFGPIGRRDPKLGCTTAANRWPGRKAADSPWKTGPTACFLRADIPEYRADVRDQVKRRILRGFSVEMEVKAEDWPTPDKRIIRSATLWNIGLVDRPAYDEATAAIAKRAKEACRVAPRLWPLAV